MNREDEKMHSEKAWNKKIQNKKVPRGKEKIHKRYSIKKGLKERNGSLIIKIMAAIIIGVDLISQINILLVNKFSKDFARIKEMLDSRQMEGCYYSLERC